MTKLTVLVPQAFFHRETTRQCQQVYSFPEKATSLSFIRLTWNDDFTSFFWANDQIDIGKTLGKAENQWMLPYPQPHQGLTRVAEKQHSLSVVYQFFQYFSVDD
jgi:hypothetical protein